MPKPTVVIKNFLGGWNCDTAPSELQVNELAIADNIDLKSGGDFGTRMGVTPLNDTAYDGPLLWTKKWVKSDGTNVILGVISLTTGYFLYEIGTAGGALTLICEVKSSDIAIEFHLTYALILDGTTYRYWDGTHLYDAAPATPVAPAVTAQSGGVSGVGLYYCVVVLVNSIGAESALSPVISVTTAAASNFEWNNIPLGNASTMARKLYRTKVNSDVYYYVDTIEDNTTIHYTDKIADVNLVDAHVVYDINPIERCKYLVRQPTTSRFFAAGDKNYPSRLHWSEIDNPGCWLEDSYYEPLTGGGPILGVDVFSDGVLVMYASGFYAWRGINPGSTTDADDTGNVTWSKLPVDHGAINSRSTSLTPGTFSFLSLGGLWSLSELIYSDINVSLFETSNMVKNLAQNKVLTEINAITNKEVCRLVWDIPRQRLLLAYTTDAGTVAAADKILVYHWGIGGGFTRYTGLTVYDFCLLDTGEMLISSGKTIYKMNSGGDDAGVAIETKVETAFYDIDAPMIRKKLSKLFITTEGGNSASTIQILVTNGKKTVSVSPILLYASGLWNNDWYWDDTVKWPESGILDKERVVQGVMEGSEFQVKIYHTSLGERIKIFGIGLQYHKYTAKGDRSK
jgi:hypothetical protein